MPTRPRHPLVTRSRRWTAGAVLVALAPFGASSAQELTGEIVVRPEEWLGRQESFEIRFNRDPAEPDERLVVLIDRQDVTALFERAPSTLRYRSRLLPLSQGEHEVAVHVRQPDGEWRELATGTVRVAGRFGIESTSADRSMTIGLESRVASNETPAPSFPQRETFQDLSAQAALGWTATRDGAEVGVNSSFVGTNRHEESLRYGDLGDDAPLLDLASFGARFARGGIDVQAGHVQVGSQRHLLNSFSSRGATLTVPLGARAQVTAGALGGSNVVGWSDLLGFAKPQHRLAHAQIGWEATSRPGQLRVELAMLDGSVLPRAGFGQGAVTDAKTSRGASLGLRSELAGGRVRVDGGLTRSRFTNPFDPALAGDTTLVEVRPETRNAWFASTAVDLLRAASGASLRDPTLAIEWAEERVDPLFESIGAYASPDRLERRFVARSDLGVLQLTASHQRTRNNLDDIPSILTTHGRRTTTEAGTSLSRVLGFSDVQWLPALRWRSDIVHQFGEGIPENGGFDASHVPDQLQRVHELSADWQIGRTSAGVRLERATQDNRQPGRETADFETEQGAVRLGVSPHHAVEVTVEGSIVRNTSLERDETERTRRLSGGITWRPSDWASLTMQRSGTRILAALPGSLRTDGTTSAQLAISTLGPFGGRRGSWFIRYARGDWRTRVDLASPDESRTTWSLDTGLSLRVFQ